MSSVPGDVILHLQHHWPLVAAALVLLGLVTYAASTGVMPTNQRRILRSTEPVAFRRWLRGLSTLFVLTLAVLVGSYFLGGK